MPFFLAAICFYKNAASWTFLEIDNIISQPAHYGSLLLNDVLVHIFSMHSVQEVAVLLSLSLFFFLCSHSKRNATFRILGCKASIKNFMMFEQYWLSIVPFSLAIHCRQLSASIRHANRRKGKKSNETKIAQVPLLQKCAMCAGIMTKDMLAWLKCVPAPK